MLDCLSAQTDVTDKLQCTVKGCVVDSLSKEPIPYATLRIASASSPRKDVKLSTCDENGKFIEMINLPGDYVLTIQFLGKETINKYFKIDGRQKEIDLGNLSMKENVQKLKGVTVSAQKTLVKMDIDKLTYNMEDDPESKTNNTLDMLRKVPLVTVDSDDKIQLKGSSNYKIFLNGKPSNLLSGGNASEALKSMPANSIKNIEVITDPGAKYDAEGIGGIINIVTVRNKLQGYTGTVRANASSFGSFGADGYLTMKVNKLGLTANYGYNNRNTPWYDSRTVRETEHDVIAGNKPSRLIEEGRSKNRAPFHYGFLEASYEIDSLNLLSIGANLFRGNSNIKSELDASLGMIDAKETSRIYSYHRDSRFKNNFGSADVNIDFQHTGNKKDEYLTLSYRFSHSPNDNDNHTELSEVENYYLAEDFPQWNINDASTTEHTAQVDYTTPTWKNHTMEGGVKYINRQSKSETLEQIYRTSSESWEDVSAENSRFKHTQHIHAAYIGYQMKFKKLGVKFGLRGEGTNLTAKFAQAPDMNFNVDYFDIVPNAALAYQLDMTSQILIGYNMRIQRPGISYLNPYIDNTNPQAVTQGNPNLESEKSNNFDLNFGKFGRKFSINTSLYYTYINNSIERYSEIADFPTSDPRSQYNGALWNSYGNIGKKSQVGLFVYGNLSPARFVRIFLNGGIDYTDLDSKARSIKNNGFAGRITAGSQFTLPKDFSVNLQGGYFSPVIMLQGEQSPFYFAGINISKSFFCEKLSVSVSMQNPVWKTMKMEMTTTGNYFSYVSTNWRNSREFRLSVSYRFGTLKEKIKKVRRSIKNDDVKGDNNNSNSGKSQEM
jgi:outer membrane receptor protein involved in Fe transport